MGGVTWLGVVTLIQSGVIGAAVAYVAWQQWKTAREKIIIELFDKRFSLYEKAREAIGPIIRIRHSH